MHVAAFVAIEGIDASGKSTLASLLQRRLLANGIPAILCDKHVRPADPLGRNQLDGIATALWHYPRDADIASLGDAHWLHLMAAWYTALGRTVVRPALTRGEIVIADGWIGKYVARFLLKPDFDLKRISEFFSDIDTPGMTVWLDTPPSVAMGRRSDFKPSECGHADRASEPASRTFLGYQARVAAKLVLLAASHTWLRMDGNRPVDDIAGDVYAMLRDVSSTAPVTLTADYSCQGQAVSCGHSLIHRATLPR